MRENIDINGLATYDFRDFSQKRYKNITKSVFRKFRLEYAGEFLDERDHKQQRFSKNESSVNIEWEFMVEYVIYSNNVHSNVLAKEIAEFVYDKYEH